MKITGNQQDFSEICHVQDNLFENETTGAANTGSHWNKKAEIPHSSMRGAQLRL